MNDWVLLGPVIGIVGLIFFLLLLKPLYQLLTNEYGDFAE